MPDAPDFDRRALGRELTRIGRASVRDTLAGFADSGAAPASRIGVTGPPGAGKSTLIARLAEHRLARVPRIGVLAIDPTSPVSQGSILGDRVRMDGVAQNPGLYIRSMPSRYAHDGLSDNVADLMNAMEAFGFDDLIVETVGVGQADYAIRTLVDTVVLVVVPESGDAIQAMKAGILEMADIYVINKADLPGADRAAAEIRSVLGFHRYEASDWRPPVIKTSSRDDDLDALDAAIEAHLAWTRETADLRQRQRARNRYHVQSLINRRLGELMDGTESDLFDRPIREIYEDFVRRLEDASAEP